MTPPLVCAILAAGRGSRMGGRKTLLHVGDVTLVERAVRAARGFPTIVVCPSSEFGAVTAVCGNGIRLVANDAPERGMTHSLRLADAGIEDRRVALAVLLVDTPLVDASVIARLVAASHDSDVTYPITLDGRPGHPVIFGWRARAMLEALEDGDTLRTLRDDPRLTRCKVVFDDERPFLDVDFPADLATAHRAS